MILAKSSSETESGDGWTPFFVAVRLAARKLSVPLAVRLPRILLAVRPIRTI